MHTAQFPIAVFDSGVGGISVLCHLRRLMPRERFLYYGDTAHAPYGCRTTEDVRRLALDAAAHLTAKGIKALVVACNTATAAAITDLRQAYPQLTVVGIEPALKPAATAYPGGTIGVLATPVTLREEKFHALSRLYGSGCTVIPLPAPGLADLVEQGMGDSAEARELLQPILSPHWGKLDALVLGCTHYPFAKAAIRSLLGPEIPLFDGGEGTAREARRQLAEKGLLLAGKDEILWEASGELDEKLCRSLLEGFTD